MIIDNFKYFNNWLIIELLLYRNFFYHQYLRLSQKKLLQKNSISEIITLKKDVVCIVYLIRNTTISTCSIYIYFTDYWYFLNICNTLMKYDTCIYTHTLWDIIASFWCSILILKRGELCISISISLHFIMLVIFFMKMKLI